MKSNKRLRPSLLKHMLSLIDFNEHDNTWCGRSKDIWDRRNKEIKEYCNDILNRRKING